MKLTAKEQKCYWLDRHNRRHHNCHLTVGDYCRILHTTALTLIRNTNPSLDAKRANAFENAIYESVIYIL